MFEKLNPLASGLSPLNLLGSASAEATDPLGQLKSFFTSAFSAGNGQNQSSLCSSASASGGALGCGDACCQKNESLGF